MKLTAKQLAEKLNLNYNDSSVKTSINGFLRVLVELGMTKDVGTSENASGKGRGATIFEMPEQILIKI